MYCSDCKSNTTNSIKSKQVYYCFDRVWDILFVPILDKPQIVKLRQYIIEHILDTLSNPEFIENGYQYDQRFLNDLQELKSHTDKIDFIDTQAWGKFAFTQSEDDYSCYKLVSPDKYDDYKVLGHYFYLHECHLIAVLIWTLCSTIWPLRKWIIVDNGEHAFVMAKDDPYTIYDFIWNALGIAATDINIDDARIFDHPMQYYIQCEFGLDPNKSEDELIQDLKIDAAKYEEDVSNIRFDNRLSYELPKALAFKNIYNDSTV